MRYSIPRNCKPSQVAHIRALPFGCLILFFVKLKATVQKPTSPGSLLPISLVCLVFAFLGCSPATVKNLTEQAGARQIAAKEVLALVEGNTLLISSHEEDSYLFFDTSGRLFGKDIHANKDTGKWDVSDSGELCLRMSKWWYGDLKCYNVFQEPGNGKIHLATSSGVIAFSAGYFTGDSQNLYFAAATKRKSIRKSARKPDQVEEETESAVHTSSVEQPTADYTISSKYAKQDLRSTMVSTAKNCPDCNLAGADFPKANLIQANLKGANLNSANLKMANLRRADLRDADLRNADLSYANLPGADLRNADLRGTNLRGANLIRAKLTGANLTGAVLEDALTEGAIGLKK